uniref:Lnb N-terminal periplasmic domain-containing protein n=1 Tax=Marinobacter sp. TaxID=50741 RepID=UPI003562DBAB
MGYLMRTGQAALWLAGTLATLSAFASTPENLHQHPVWLTLGHYHQSTFGSGYASQADDPAFFLSEKGKTSPEAELTATLEAIQLPGEGNDHARCRFPARDAWLREQLDLPSEPINCPDYDEWAGTLNTEKVTLVFAASYLNSPSSMFGHTFLRLDPPQDDETDLLLAHTISYAADAAQHDSELLFAYRGIFGGYPGVTAIKPYYEMIRLYNDIEHRDLWEYTLNLSQQEVDTMLAHTWEIQDKNFDYYFFDENCAYRLLALIDVARPGTALLEEVSTHAIPSDTVRWVRDKKLIESIHYRPSAATAVSHNLNALPAEHQTIAAAIANGYLKLDAPEVKALNNGDKARLLDTTYDYLRYQSEADAWPREFAAPLSHQLLVVRSSIQNAQPIPAVPTPIVRDDQGHDTFRLSLSSGQLAHKEFTQLAIRPAYHDIADPPEGYRT